jgi:hypothetical protein
MYMTLSTSLDRVYETVWSLQDKPAGGSIAPPTQATTDSHVALDFGRD